MARTELFSRTQAGGVFTIAGIDKNPNDIFFVHSGTGTDGAGYGQNPDAPCATLDYAIGLCTASKGDKIYVLPGHAETISTVALSPTFDKAGVTVECLGEGDNRPIWTFTHADASFIYSAANVKFIRPLSKTDVDSQVIVHDVNVADVTIVDPELRTGSAKQYLTGIDITGTGANACDRAKVVRPVIIQTAVGGTRGIELGEVADQVVIEDPVIFGDWSEAGIHNPIGKVLTSLHLNGGTIQNLNTGSHAVELVSACTGAADNLKMYGDTLGTILDPGSLKCNGCTETDAIDQAGVPSPITAAGSLGAGAIGASTFQAGAIDATAIAAGAIDAATFAAGAIDATAIAAGAIDAATFAAGAIDAAAIANGAIDANTFAAGAIDAAAIAADAIDAGALALSVGEKTTEGIVVTRATAAIPQTAAAALFTVTGHVLLKRIVGVVTVVIGAVANATKIVGNSTGAGASTDLCTTVELNGAAQDSRLEITGTFANAMVKTVDVPLAKVQVTDIVIPPGTIDLDCAGNDGGGGRIRWSVTYVPMESGAQIVAA